MLYQFSIEDDPARALFGYETPTRLRELLAPPDTDWFVDRSLCGRESNRDVAAFRLKASK
jgi:hypothetical protein